MKLLDWWRTWNSQEKIGGLALAAFIGICLMFVLAVVKGWFEIAPDATSLPLSWRFMIELWPLATALAYPFVVRQSLRDSMRDSVRSLGYRGSEECLPSLCDAIEAIDRCIDSARQIGQTELLKKATKARRLMPAVALECKILRERNHETTSSFEKEGYKARMNAVEAELKAACEYFNEQRKLVEEALAVVGRNSILMEDLPATSKLSSLIGEGAAPELIEDNSAPAESSSVIPIQSKKKNGSNGA